MWEASSCSKEGYKFPEKLSEARLNELDSWELRLLLVMSALVGYLLAICCFQFHIGISRNSSMTQQLRQMEEALLIKLTVLEWV